MIKTIIELVIAVAGLAAAAVLFCRIPRLPKAAALSGTGPAVSVIIPARNEEKTLGLLLGDLARQTLPPGEIIVSDDASEDRTAAVALAHGVRLVRADGKPESWTGKTWACHCGAGAARGALLLFLDADVRLDENAVHRLVSAHMRCGGTVSVQPWHRTERHYEQCSLLFNLVQIAANGTALPRRNPQGLYGPVLLIPRKDYGAVGGHKAVSASIIEDMSLGLLLRRHSLPFEVFAGDQGVSFRMYGGGFRSLLEGWTKNLAAGASKTSVPVFLLVFLWISSLASAPFHIVTALFSAEWMTACLYGAFYIVWAGLLRLLSAGLGRFQLWATLAYPIPLLVFLSVFLLSSVKKLFRLKVTWKGRAVPVGSRRCD